jgi:hypothetical protein
VNVIRHNDSGVEKVLRVVVMQATTQDDRSSLFRKYPSLKCAEGHEMPLEIPLQMRQFSPLKHNSRSHSRLGCPAKAKPSGVNPKA